MFIDEHRERFGVEPICQTLDVSASAYYQRATGERSARRVEDERLTGRIREVHEANYECYGYRRVHAQLIREDEHAGRDQVARLMRCAGIQGAKRRGKPWRTTIPDPQAQRPCDLVKRDFTALAPDRLWVGDLTYLRTWEGRLYFAFIIDVYSRMIVGWQLAGHMRTTLVLDALRMALGVRAPGADFQLVAHTDQGSQPWFNRSSQHLSERSCDGSTASEVRSSRSAGDVLAGSSVGGASRGASAVLGGDRSRCVDGGCGRGSGSVGSGWRPVVPRGWRDANCHPGAVVRASPVIH